jgi:Na+-transporting methylmalonyl-CoA/oxaloacetate decarboxylase gamma subunit
MKIFSVLLILVYLQIIISYSVEDFVIEEVKRTINLKKSIISIENQIRLKKTTFEDTFRYLVPKIIQYH